MSDKSKTAFVFDVRDAVSCLQSVRERVCCLASDLVCLVVSCWQSAYDQSASGFAHGGTKKVPKVGRNVRVSACVRVHSLAWDWAQAPVVFWYHKF